MGDRSLPCNTGKNRAGGWAGSNNEEATVLHLEYEVKKVCFGRKVLGRSDPNPRAGHSSGNSCPVLVAEALKSAMTGLPGGGPREPGLSVLLPWGLCAEGGDGEVMF